MREKTDLPVEAANTIDPETLTLKGRVAFSGAKISVGAARETDQIATVNMAPKLSFAPFYLAGDNKDWSDETATFAGRKRYLPRAPGGGSELAAIRERLKAQIDVLPDYMRNNRQQQSRLRFLVSSNPSPLRFVSRIGLHNVTAEEIGLILFTLKAINAAGGSAARLRRRLWQGARLDHAPHR